MEDPVAGYFFAIFPVFFIGFWIAIASLLGRMSGWFRLQKIYSAPSERALRTLRFMSGSMGTGMKVGLGGILTLRACPSGLKISILRLFGPFQRPFLVPWDQIRTDPVTRFFTPMARLTFGPGDGELMIDARAWHQLTRVVQDAPPALLIPEIPRRRFRAMLLQWLVITAFAATFFTVASRSQGQAIPLAVCIGFPAVMFGVPQLVRYLRQLRLQ